MKPQKKSVEANDGSYGGHVLAAFDNLTEEKIHDIGGGWNAQLQPHGILCLFKGKEALYLGSKSVETLKAILNGAT